MTKQNANVDYMAAEVGELIPETFSIKVKGEDDVVLFEDKASPFSWRKVSGLREIFQAEGAEFTADQENFVKEAFSTDEQGAVIAALIELYNDNERNKAKANAYQKLMNQYKPASEEDKAKALENAYKNLSKALGISLEDAKAMVDARK